MTDILLYTTSWCPFCVRAKMLLDHKGLEYREINLDREPAKRIEMMERSGRRSVPQIFFGDTHVGGCDDLFALERNDGIESLLAQA
ncbi:MAG: glutaredoxin 3 [Oceanospirillaceae bacterium]|nr:glutaredoxin 3 [Oceanospirillaceae bacterium]